MNAKAFFNHLLKMMGENTSSSKKTIAKRCAVQLCEESESEEDGEEDDDSGSGSDTLRQRFGLRLGLRLGQLGLRRFRFVTDHTCTGLSA
eukprot:2258155-Prymnesium_polylepis.3